MIKDILDLPRKRFIVRHTGGSFIAGIYADRMEPTFLSNMVNGCEYNPCNLYVGDHVIASVVEGFVVSDSGGVLFENTEEPLK